MVIAFRGTQTTKEWIEDFTASMMHLDGEPEEKGFARYFNRQVQHINPGYSVILQEEKNATTNLRIPDSRSRTVQSSLILSISYMSTTYKYRA